MSVQTRPVIAMDIEFWHYRDPQTQEVVGVDQYLTDFAFRDKYRIFNRYVDSIHEAGGLPLLVPCFTEEDVLKEYVDLADGFLFVGLDDYPPEFYREPRQIETKVQTTEGYKRHAASNVTLARLVLDENDGMPALGICAGPQLFTIVRGGKLIQHVPAADDHRGHTTIRDNEHEIEIRGGRILADLFGERRITVNTNHHQAPDPDHLGTGLQATAFADDGVVEAVESIEERFVIGVQWHPERMRDAAHRKKVFGAFIRAAEEYRENKGE